MARTPKSRIKLYSKQWPNLTADKKTTPYEDMTEPQGHGSRLTSKFNEQHIGVVPDNPRPKSAKETLTRRWRLGRAKHTPHPAPIKGGHYRETPQMERPHYEEFEDRSTEMGSYTKTMTEAVAHFNAVLEGRHKKVNVESTHMMTQLMNHVKNPEMHPLKFKNGQTAKIPEPLAHKAMQIHDKMEKPADKAAYINHISKSIEHFKSGVKSGGKVPAEPKKKISLAGPQMRKEEHDDEGWYAHREMHGDKGVSREDWRKGVRMKADGTRVQTKKKSTVKEDIKAEYDSLKKHDINKLRGMIKGSNKVSDLMGYKSKDHAITKILRDKHGDKKVDAAFAEDYAPLESGEKLEHPHDAMVKAKSRKQGGDKPIPLKDPVAGKYTKKEVK